jgi:hypothetical protein
VPIKPEIRPNTKYKDPMSLWFVEKNQRFIHGVTEREKSLSIFLINNIV